MNTIGHEENRFVLNLGSPQSNDPIIEVEAGPFKPCYLSVASTRIEQADHQIVSIVHLASRSRCSLTVGRKPVHHSPRLKFGQQSTFLVGGQVSESMFRKFDRWEHQFRGVVAHSPSVLPSTTNEIECMFDGCRTSSLLDTVTFQPLQVLRANFVQMSVHSEQTVEHSQPIHQVDVIRRSLFGVDELNHSIPNRDSFFLSEMDLSVQLSSPRPLHLVGEPLVGRPRGLDVSPSVELELDVPEFAVASFEDRHIGIPDEPFQSPPASGIPFQQTTDPEDLGARIDKYLLVGKKMDPVPGCYRVPTNNQFPALGPPIPQPFWCQELAGIETEGSNLTVPHVDRFITFCVPTGDVT
jgi:hypothetical protein